MLSSWASASPARPKVLQDIVQRLARQHKGSGITPFEGGWAEKFSLGEELMEKVGMLADEKPTPLSLHQLYTFGRHPTPSQRLSNAQFLHRELPIRLSQRAWELMHLPHGLSNAPGIQLVSSCYALYAGDLSKARRPRNAMEEHEYTCLIAALLLDATAIPQALGLGLRDQGFACLDEKGLGDLDDILCRFFTGRIGLRFLMEHHISTTIPRPGFSGIIQSAVDPVLLAKKAAMEVTELCQRQMGAVPSVDVIMGGHSVNAAFTYVPSHMSFILVELLKNSLRAVVEAHHETYKEYRQKLGPVQGWTDEDVALVTAKARSCTSSVLPPVKVIVVIGKEDVTIKVADEGGGVRRSEEAQCWTFFGTSARLGAQMGRVTGDQESEPPMAGRGLGLPVSRIYSEYFGGSLRMHSTEGFGMDSYCHLNRLGHNCESLPVGVQTSPAERDSTPTKS